MRCIIGWLFLMQYFHFRSVLNAAASNIIHFKKVQEKERGS